jgi:hypothetical protein
VINHVRTLLRNMPPEPYAGEDGQEIVDPSFRQVALPAHLAAARTALFGRRPDRAGLDLKLRRYMAVLHSTGLADHVVADDPRITYAAPVVDRLEFDFLPAVAGVGHAEPLYLSGDPPAEDGGGALAYAWDVAVAAGTAVRVSRLRPNMQDETVPVVYAAGLCDPFPLAGSGLAARFHSGLAVGTRWSVTCTARPSAGLGGVVASLDAIGEDSAARIFGTPPAGPYVVWAGLWHSGAPLPYRLGAILLAVAARTDELRKGA